MLWLFLRSSWAPFYSTAHRKWKGLPLLHCVAENTNTIQYFHWRIRDIFTIFSCRAACTILSDPRTRICFPSTLVGFYSVKVGLEKCFEILAIEVLKRHRELLWWDETPTWLLHEPPHCYRSLWRSKAVLIWLFPPFFFFDRKNLILFELFIDIEIQNLEAHQPLKALPGRSLSAFLWPGLLLPARQSWKVSPWAPNTEWKPWMLPGHKLKLWTHSNWIFILSIL